jgi:hypothetical protein
MTTEQAKKSALWRYFVAMMTEKKAGVMAASFTRVLGITTFVGCTVMWVLEGAGVGSGPPDMMVYTFWGLAGIKGAKDTAKALKGGSSYE